MEKYKEINKYKLQRIIQGFKKQDLQLKWQTMKTASEATFKNNYRQEALL